MRRARNIAWLMLVALMPCIPLAALATPPTIFAAASLEPALNQMAHAGVLGKPAPKLVYAASSALARQIDDGAPADLFISADERWMDDVAKHGAIVAATRTDLLDNALVVIAPRASKVRLDFSQGAAAAWLAALGNNGRLAIALPGSVPAGIYAKQSLQKLGLWNALQPRMAMTRDVRAALNLVVLGQCPLGIVYRSGAVSEPRVRIVATFPTDSHKPIVYPVAIVHGHDDAASRALLKALQSPRARAVFRHWGFAIPAGAKQTVGE
jgi:molybdate transport system substrate-binding protein